MNALLLATVLSASAATPPQAPTSVYELPKEAFLAQARRDLTVLKQFDDGLHRTMQVVLENKALFSTVSKSVYSAEQKRTILSTWGTLYAYFSSLEQLRQRYWEFVKLLPTDERHPWGFVLTHTALTGLLATGLQFADLAAGNQQLETLFDEPNAEFGLPKGSFADFKLKSIHVATTTQLMTGEAWGPTARKALDAQKTTEPLVPWAWQQIKADTAAAQASLKKKGVALYLKNATDIVKDSSAQAVFPAQKSFAEWAGDTRVARVGKPLLTPAQSNALVPRLQPGDIVVVRQNWFLSNIGLPGFWPHAELYVGAANELAAAMDSDAQVSAWALSQPEKAPTLTALLQQRYPAKWKAYATEKDFQGHAPVRVIEAISEGVSFTALEHAFGVDYLGVMRPRVGKVDKARAIVRAFEYQGRPYDFDFDFFSDATLVCSELVYKSYAPAAGQAGVSIELVDVAGRRTLPANEYVKLFDAQFDRPDRQLDFVAFFDGQEKEGVCKESDVATFRKTHARLKWDIAQK